MHYICCKIEIKVNFLEFKSRMFDLACFNIHQVYAWKPGFDRNNFVRWSQKGLLVRLRQGFYTFPEYLNKPDFTLYFANRIYRPSYISLHSALSFYGIIPEAVVQITSITSLKTISFVNSAGEYSYKSVKDDLMFGYDLRPINDGRTIQMASPEKAILDLLYIYSFYNTADDMLELRFDEDFLNEKLNLTIMNEHAQLFRNKALEMRLSVMLNAYGL